MLEQAIQRDSLQLDAYVLLGASYLKQEVPEVAQLKAEQGLQHFPNAGSLSWIRAEALFQQQQFTKALSLYSKLYKEYQINNSLQPLQVNKTDIKERFIQVNKALASEAFSRNDLDKAKNYIKKVRQLNPGDAETQKNLVYLYLKQQKWKKALKEVNKALENDPENRDLLRMKASAFYNLKNIEGLKEEYRKLYEQDPDDIKTALTYAEILVGSQQSSMAIKIYEQLLDKYPDERRIYEALIGVNERRLNIKGKRAVLRRMESRYPDDQNVSRDIAATFEQEDKWAEARAVYDSLLTSSGDSLLLQKKIAQTYVEQDSLLNAEYIYKQLYHDNQRDRALVLRYGKVLENQEKWSEAGSRYKEFIARKKDQEVYYRLGITLMALNKNQQAIEYFRDALEMGSQDPDLYLRLSQLMAKGGSEQLTEARLKSKRALELSLEELQKTQQKVEQSLNENSLGNQVKNQERFKKLKKLNSLAERAFKHFTDINSRSDISKMFDQIESEYPGSGRLQYLIGDYYREAQEYDIAKSYYQEAIKYTPRLREAHIGLARLFDEGGQNVSAIRSYERALSLNPEQPGPYDALIRLYRKQGELNSLCDRWKALYRANIDNKILKEFLIEALHKSERYDEAKQLIKEE